MSMEKWTMCAFITARSPLEEIAEIHANGALGHAGPHCASPEPGGRDDHP